MRRLNSGAVALAVALGASPLPAWSQASGFGNTPARPAPTAPVAPPPVIVAPPVAPPSAPVVPAPAPASPTVAIAPRIVVPTPGPFVVEQSATGVTVRNLSGSFGSFSVLAPRIEIAGTTLAAADVARLLDPASGVPAAARIAGLSASSVLIPELYTTSRTEAGTQTALHRDIRLSDLANGKLASAIGDGAVLDQMAAGIRSEGRYGRMEFRDVDLGHLLALFTEPAPAGAPAPMLPIYASASIEGLSLGDGRGGTFGMSRLAARDVAGRRTADGWAATMARASVPPDPADKASPAKSAAFGAVLDLLSAYEIGSLEATGLVGIGATPSEPGMKVARMGYRGGAGRPPEATIDGFEAGQAGNGVSIASMTVTGLGILPMLQAAKDMAAAPEGGFSPADLRRFVPGTALVRITGIGIRSDVSGRPTQIGLGSFEFGVDKPIEGIPSDIRFAVRDISVPLDPNDPTVAPALGLGIDRVEASVGASLGYSEPSSTIALRDLSIRAAGLGSVVVRGVLGNVSRDIFNPDQALATVAAVGATMRTLDVTVENTGLFEKVVARQAADTGRSAAEIRRDYGLAAAVGIPVMLGNSAAAKELGQAVARFVAKPGRLAIQVRTRDPAGLGFTDFAAAADPTMLLDKIDITAVAE